MSLVIPSRARPITGRKIRFGLVGCGRIAANHIGAIQAHSERAELVAVCDVSPESLADIHRYFSGELAKDFEGAKTTIEKKAIRYEHNNRRAWVDSERGVLTRYERPSIAGGKDEIEILKYVFEEGLWLPAEMRLRNRDSGWEVRLQFQKWTTGK